MSGLNNLSIRTVLGLVIGLMGLLLVVLSTMALVDALDRNQAARRVAALAGTTQSLFKALQSHRLERGNELAPLMADAPAAASVDQVVGGNRKSTEEGYTDGMAALARLDLPGLPATVAKLAAAHDAVAALRPKADAALHQPKSSRDAALLQDWPKQTQALLNALSDTSDVLEADLKLVDPIVDQLLSIKRVTVSKSLNVKLEFTLPKGEHALKLYVICDSYVGADHDINLDPVDVAEGEDSDSDEEDSDGSGSADGDGDEKMKE